jgi:hypothetical protein
MHPTPLRGPKIVAILKADIHIDCLAGDKVAIV